MTVVRVLLLVGAGLLAAACGGDDGAGDAAEPAPRAAATAPPKAAQPAPAKAGSARVAIEDFEYRPAKLKVSPGTRVSFSNADAANHTVTFASAKAGRGIPNLREGQRKTIRLRAAGSYAYVCEFHPTMRGRIEVAR